MQQFISQKTILCKYDWREFKLKFESEISHILARQNFSTKRSILRYYLPTFSGMNFESNMCIY